MSYREFVKKWMADNPKKEGQSQADRMKAAAAAWNKHKGGAWPGVPYAGAGVEGVGELAVLPSVAYRHCCCS